MALILNGIKEKVDLLHQVNISFLPKLILLVAIGNKDTFSLILFIHQL